MINDAVSVVLLGAIDRSVKNGAWTGGFLFNFAFLLFFSFALGAVVGLGIAWVLKTSAFAGPHQVRFPPWSILACRGRRGPGTFQHPPPTRPSSRGIMDLGSNVRQRHSHCDPGKLRSRSHHPHQQTIHRAQELAILTLLAYSSWLLADLMGLSAILSLFVTGMMVRAAGVHSSSHAPGREHTLT